MNDISNLLNMEFYKSKSERLDAELTAEFGRRVPVEQYLLDCYHGKKPLPDKEKCLELAQKLGKNHV